MCVRLAHARGPGGPQAGRADRRGPSPDCWDGDAYDCSSLAGVFCSPAAAEGSTASPPLWVIQLQPLTSFLRRQVEQGALCTPLLPSGEQAPPAAHHADDTTLTARDPAVDGPVLMAAVQLFCRASNARVHPDKSKAMGLGRFAHLFFF
ncbi:hypothetical protein CHLRE_30g758197v5 [Chlamydomonas reinhardtii]|uniref:Reverse transcriptase domain-containing protein n=1 Tax=Chlamydomonas reinhardtii TaxID=3055 RepID=A0A2K3CMZ2_CHLRE|nr:uncharacterized protein CHLRE_30g758197v5 [Chlamydomonas reinhardtii]PNW69644.1 hypothetical protein CHLRE_30g758197v5 [Chlamydomonas reinhardtii]